MEDLDLATAAVYPLRHEAEIAKARLASEGIPSIVSADDEGGLNPGFFAEYGIRLVVRREQLSQAEAILTETLDAANDGIYLQRGHLDAFVAHARFCAPQEGCGLVALVRPVASVSCTASPMSTDRGIDSRSIRPSTFALSNMRSATAGKSPGPSIRTRRVPPLPR